MVGVLSRSERGIGPGDRSSLPHRRRERGRKDGKTEGRKDDGNASLTWQYPVYPVQKPLRPPRSAVNTLPQLRPRVLGDLDGIATIRGLDQYNTAIGV